MFKLDKISYLNIVYYKSIQLNPIPTQYTWLESDSTNIYTVTLTVYTATLIITFYSYTYNFLHSYTYNFLQLHTLITFYSYTYNFLHSYTYNFLHSYTYNFLQLHL